MRYMFILRSMPLYLLPKAFRLAESFDQTHCGQVNTAPSLIEKAIPQYMNSASIQTGHASQGPQAWFLPLHLKRNYT